MEKCQICSVCNGTHKVEIQGICGNHAEQIKDLLHWWEENKEALKETDIKKLSKKF